MKQASCQQFHTLASHSNRISWESSCSCQIKCNCSSVKVSTMAYDTNYHKSNQSSLQARGFDRLKPSESLHQPKIHLHSHSRTVRVLKRVEPSDLVVGGACGFHPKWHDRPIFRLHTSSVKVPGVKDILANARGNEVLSQGLE